MKLPWRKTLNSIGRKDKGSVKKVKSDDRDK